MIISSSVQHYQVHDRLFAGEYPGSLAPEVTEDRLRSLLERGVQTFIDLTTPDDHLDPYEPVLRELGEGLKRHSHKIPDLSIPETPQVMRGILDLLRAELDAGRTCYVHCWGGIGRTGTVIGCWLKESGLDATAALDEVQRLYASGMEKVVRHPRSPQTPEQVRYVKEWR
ncbi:protein-tyrosine phosphatase family protein [Luteolibacter soli]|uniref:Tyrosine specific protein phosphatases domain-containing protein n=1 Tax=Luteolibacter soli TaxID=3135280 RepID=A0ABU9AZY7_9BACT